MSQALFLFPRSAKYKNMRALLFLLISLPAFAGAIPERIETALKDRIAAGELPAAVVAMVDGENSAIEGFGALADGKPPDGDTQFEIGSITKTFTATLLAEEAVAGKLTLDTPLKILLPDFTLPRYEGREIILAEIAEQHSGLPRLPDNFHPKDAADPYADYDAASLKAFLAGYKLPRPPGETYEYSNLAVGLLGYALARRHRETYRDLVAARILKPLGMASSGVGLPHPTQGYDAQGHPVGPWGWDALAGAGGIGSSGADMLRYLKAYMGRIDTPLRAAMDLARTARRDAAPNFRIGLIWMTSKAGDQSIIWHNGMTGGYASFIGFTADGKKGVVILTNQAQSVDMLGFAALADAVPLAPGRKAIDLPAGQLDAYEGTYRLKDKFFITVTTGGGQLFARGTGQELFPLFASGPDQFFAKITDITLRFTRDGQGAVTGLVLHQGTDFPSPRVSEHDAAAELGAIDLDGKTLRAYEGSYQLLPGQILTISAKDGHLQSRFNDLPPSSLFPRSAERFFYLAVNAELDFQRGADGQVSGLILHEGSQNLPAPKVIYQRR